MAQSVSWYAYRNTVQWPMIQTFRHRGLKRLYERGDPSKVRTDQAERIALTLADLDDASISPRTLICRVSAAPAEGQSGGIVEYFDFRKLADHLPL